MRQMYFSNLFQWDDERDRNVLEMWGNKCKSLAIDAKPAFLPVGIFGDVKWPRRFNDVEFVVADKKHPYWRSLSGQVEQAWFLTDVGLRSDRSDLQIPKIG